jgi:hypothetical protein
VCRVDSTGSSPAGARTRHSTLSARARLHVFLAVVKAGTLYIHSPVKEHAGGTQHVRGVEQPLWQARERPRDRSRGHRSQLSEVTALRVPSRGYRFAEHAGGTQHVRGVLIVVGNSHAPSDHPTIHSQALPHMFGAEVLVGPATEPTVYFSRRGESA